MGASGGKPETEHVMPVQGNWMTGQADMAKTGMPNFLRTARKPSAELWMSEMDWYSVVQTVQATFTAPSTDGARGAMRKWRSVAIGSMVAMIPAFMGGFGMSFAGCSPGTGPVCIIGIIFAVGFLPAIVLREMPGTIRGISESYSFLDFDIRDATVQPPQFKLVVRLVQPREEAEELLPERKGVVVGRVFDHQPLPHEVPDYWERRCAGSEHFISRCQLDFSSEDFACLAGAIQGTYKPRRTRDRQGEMPKGLKLINCQRVENSKLWSKYEQRVSAIKRKYPMGCAKVDAVQTSEHLASMSSKLQASLNELYLWHGTSPAGANGVSEDGFRLDMSGRNVGSMFGNGAYFAECSSKADEYARSGDGIYEGMFALLLCRVVCGEMLLQTRPDKKRIDAQMKSGNVDSVLGDREASVGTYREFVVFDVASIYPEYVLVYVREFN